MPAIFFLGIWFLMQFLSGVGSIGRRSASAGGIAFWAHVAGFVAGVIGVFLFDGRSASASNGGTMSREPEEKFRVPGSGFPVRVQFDVRIHGSVPGAVPGSVEQPRRSGLIPGQGVRQRVAAAGLSGVVAGRG